MIFADFLIMLIGMSLALLFSRPLMTLMISVIVQSSRNKLDSLDFLRNSVKGVMGLTSKSSLSESFNLDASDMKYLLNSFE